MLSRANLITHEYFLCIVHLQQLIIFDKTDINEQTGVRSCQKKPAAKRMAAGYFFIQTRYVGNAFYAFHACTGLCDSASRCRRERIACVPRQCLRDNSARHNGEKSYIRSFGTHTMRSLHFCFCSQICLQMYWVHIFRVHISCVPCLYRVVRFGKSLP